MNRYAPVALSLFVSACSIANAGSLQRLTATDGAVLNQAETLLIFVFPDGVRGGHGKIKGTGPGTWSSELGSSIPEDTLAELKRCGLTDSRRVAWESHRAFAVGRSSSRNEQVVQCYKSRTDRHFDVGIGRSWPFDFDSSGFRHHWNTKSEQGRVED